MGNEKRLIDGNALEAAITTDYWEHFTQCHDTDQIALIDMVCEDIGNAPTVDAVEVVRCKDCKHNVANKAHDPLDATDYTDIVCDYWMNDGNRPDDFCSYGERKDKG